MGEIFMVVEYKKYFGEMVDVKEQYWIDEG